MDFQSYTGQWFYNAEGEQQMFSAAHAVEEHWSKGWRLTLEEAQEVAMAKKLAERTGKEPEVTSPAMTTPVQAEYGADVEPEETPEERRRRKSRESMAKARAAKKAAN